MGINWAKIGIAAGGALFGSYGVKILGSKTMQKGYTRTTAAVLRMKDEVVKDFTLIQEGCEDILAEAKELNEERAQMEEAQLIQDAKDFLAAVEAEDEVVAPAEA